MRAKNFKIILFFILWIYFLGVQAEERTIKLANDNEIGIDIPDAYVNYLPEGIKAIQELATSNIYLWVRNPEPDANMLVYLYPKLSLGRDEKSFIESRKSILLDLYDTEELKFSDFKEISVNGLKAWQSRASGVYKMVKAKGSNHKFTIIETIYAAPNQYVILRERTGIKPDAFISLENEFIKSAASVKLKTSKSSILNKTIDEPSIRVDIGEAKMKCSELGFKSGTEPFGKCVLRLTK